MDWLAPKYLGSFFQFKAKYCILDPKWGGVIGHKNLDELAKKIDRFTLRRTKEEVFDDFPKKTVENIEFELSEDEKKLYQAVKEEILYEVRSMSSFDSSTLNLIPVKMLRLKQCTDHPKLIEANTDKASKLDVLKDLLKPIIASGEKAIIFTQFASMLNILAQELVDFRPLTIYGDVDNIARMERVKAFNDDPMGRVIIMTEAGAYGLNMQSASYVIHYDSPWSVAKLEQREGRAHRIGQKKAVTVYNLVAKKTIDEYVLKVLHAKQKISAHLLGDADRMEKAGLSIEDINNILRL
jgi:SNF2 family DNA or RNA helicase